MAAPPQSSVQPRHMLCFLGGSADQAKLKEAVLSAVRDFATGFSVDDDHSSPAPDQRMVNSFAVSRDLVAPNAWARQTTVPSRVISRFYVLGPHMNPQDAVKLSMAALQFVGRLIDAGAVGVKGESAGSAHGLDRWRALAW